MSNLSSVGEIFYITLNIIPKWLIEHYINPYNKDLSDIKILGLYKLKKIL